MKNILFILIACLMVSMVKAAPNTTDINRRDVLLRMYSQQKNNAEMSEKFLEAVKKGDVQAIVQLEAAAENPSYLMATDKFGNNAFHLAKDIYTINAVAHSIRSLYNAKEASDKILTLKNQSNQSGVIPAVQAVFDLRPGNFLKLIEDSELSQAMTEVQRINKGGALSLAASPIRREVVKKVQLAEGFTAASFARNNQHVKGMDKVVAYFAENAPYL